MGDIVPPGGGRKGKSPERHPDDWFAPSFRSAFMGLIALRLMASTLSPIHDCDEVYNYYEPLHYLVHGKGFQTWEYAPQYALRSYALLLPFAAFLRMFNFVQPAAAPVMSFFAVRAIIGVGVSACEALAFRALAAHVSRRVSLAFLFVTALAAGSFHASVSLLPSTLSMCGSLLVVFAWLTRADMATVAVVAATLVLGWPFPVLALAPILFATLRRMGVLWTAKVAFWILLIFAVPVVALDTTMYGRFVVASYNTVMYNVLGSAEGRSSELYGTEPASWYFKNMLLNFGPAFPLAVAAPVLAIAAAIVGAPLSKPVLAAQPRPIGPSSGEIHPTAASVPAVESAELAASRRGRLTWAWLSTLLVTTPFHLWFALMLANPHKEERFLVVVYPFASIGAAVSLVALAGLASAGMRVVVARLPRIGTASPEIGAAVVRAGSRSVVQFLLFAIATASLSRIAAVASYYAAPLGLFTELGILHLTRRGTADGTFPVAGQVTVCVGKEWHRFPSSFFLPSDPRFRVQFLRSGFDGQLPRPFAAVDGTRVVRDGFNDMNRADDVDRFVRPEECHFIVDTVVPDQEEPDYAREPADRDGKPMFLVASEAPFLDAERSPPLSRAFWFPGAQAANTYMPMRILRRRDVPAAGEQIPVRESSTATASPPLSSSSSSPSPPPPPPPKDDV